MKGRKVMKQWNKFKIMILLLLGLAIGFAPRFAVAAADNEDQNDYEVQPILPDNQVNMSANFFDLEMQPEQEQTIQLRIQNFTSKTIKVESDIRNAYTQNGGGIDFAPTGTKLDNTLKVPLTDLATLTEQDKVINLGPKEAKVVTTTIKMPKQLHQGMIYGDWHFIQRVKKDAKQATAVKANYAYSIGIALRGRQYDETTASMRYVKTAPFLYNKHPAMGIELQNPAPMAFRKASVSAEIIRQGERDSGRTFQANNFMVAPNSTLKLPISWNYDAMKPGVYKIKVKFTGQNYANRFPMTWTFTKQFKVAEKEASDLNQKAAKKPKNKWVVPMIGVGLLWTIALGGLIWLLAVRPH
ncbi:DUF916 and DUF3324 domain-containing protein [Lapidilactobacillus wuchangensis]|uniref:DUF916 and DUF3324 domain-containing protein n=1 Tax=Lapidilactobacillus wuchangensis TaxID=2486001 RepID=UPI001CDC5329|nr:DUF916 and DUF3324 domain-containing protein [Lapidilactobacillus wuchangensis]